MFHKVMIPIDLTHADKLSKALRAGASLAKLHGIPVTYVAVTSAAPGAIAHTPAEFAEKLAEFGRGEAEKYGIAIETKAVVSHDPTIDLDNTLLKTVKDIGADVVVMASHIPNVTDYIWPSNGGTIASHSDASVFLVRGQ